MTSALISIRSGKSASQRADTSTHTQIIRRTISQELKSDGAGTVITATEHPASSSGLKQIIMALYRCTAEILRGKYEHERGGT